MINKTINLQKVIVVDVEGSKVEVAFVSAQMTEGLGNMSMSIQVINKKVAEDNIEEVKKQYEEFNTTFKEEANMQGWHII